MSALAQRWVVTLVLYGMLRVLPAATQPVTNAQFAGTAHIGTYTRDIVIRFSCALERGKINNLAVEIDIPASNQLQPIFNFDAFEGPTGIGGQHHLNATARTGKAQMDFASTGSFGHNGSPATTFTFSAAFTLDPRSRGALRKLQAVVETLTNGPSHLSYTVANPTKGRTAMEVSVDMSDTDAARLASATAGCRTSIR